MERSKLIGVGIIFFIIILTAFMSLHNKFNEQSNIVNTMNPIEVAQTEMKICEKIGKELFDEGVSFGLDCKIISKDKVKILVQLNKKDSNKETKNKIKGIINKVVISNHNDPKMFGINITNFPGETKMGESIDFP